MSENKPDNKNDKRKLREFYFQFFFHINNPTFLSGFKNYTKAQAQSVLEDQLSDFIITLDQHMTLLDQKEALTFFMNLFSHYDECHAHFATYCPTWKPERLSKVDHSVLLLAFYELSFEPTPFKVVINEAIEIGKKFGTKESPDFINAVLDHFHSDHSST